MCAVVTWDPNPSLSLRVPFSFSNCQSLDLHSSLVPMSFFLWWHSHPSKPAGHNRLTSQTSWCFGTHSWPPISPLAIFIESYTVTRENAPSACTPDLPLPAPCLSSPFPMYLHLVLTGAAIKLSLTSSRPTTPWDPVYSSVSSAFYPVSRP